MSFNVKVISTLIDKNVDLFLMFLSYADGTLLTEKHSSVTDQHAIAVSISNM